MSWLSQVTRTKPGRYESLDLSEAVIYYVNINGQRHRIIFASEHEAQNFLSALTSTDPRWTVNPTKDTT